MQSKQASTQLSEENEHFKSKERQLIQKLECTEKELAEKLNELALSKESVLLPPTHPPTPLRRGSHHTLSTPARPLPEVTLVDSLQANNAKLKRDLECVQTNFQLTSHKSQQLKREKKEMEESLHELQTLFDKMAGENEDLKMKFDETRTNLANKHGNDSENSTKIQTMIKTVAILEEDLDKFQKQNIELQEKLQHELSRSLEFQDIIEKMDQQAKTVKEEKSSLQLKLYDSLANLVTVEEQYTALRDTTASASAVSTKIGGLKDLYAGQLDNLKQKKDDIEQKLEVAAKCVDEAQEKICSLTESKQSLEIKVSALEARNTALSRENKTLVASSTSEVGDLRLKYVELSEQSDDKNAIVHKLEADVLKLQSKIRDLEKIKSKLSHEASRNWTLANRCQKALEIQETINFELDKVRKQKTQECTTLENELAKITIELTTASSKVTVLEDEKVNSLRQIKDTEQINFELTTKLDSIEFETESAKLSSCETQEKVFDLEERLESVKGKKLEKEAQLTSLKFTNEILEGENSTLLSQVTSLSEMVASRNEKIESLQAQLTKYDSEMTEIAQTIAELETEHGSCTKEKQALEDKIDCLKNSLQEALDFKKKAETKILSLKLDVKQMQDCNSGLEVINVDLQDKIQAQYSKIDDLNDCQELAEKRIKKLQLEIEIKDDSLKEFLDSESSSNQRLENVTFTRGKKRGTASKTLSGTALQPIQNLVD